MPVSDATTKRARSRTAGVVLTAALLATLPAAAGATDTAPQQVEVRLQKGRVVHPPSRRLVAVRDATVAIRWSSDLRGELHVHGYDIAVRLEPGRPTLTRFEARATGRFPVTSHGFGDDSGHAHGDHPLLWIEVHPE